MVGVDSCVSLGTSPVVWWWLFTTRVEQPRRLATVLLLDYPIYVLARTCLFRGSRIVGLFSILFYIIFFFFFFNLRYL